MKNYQDLNKSKRCVNRLVGVLGWLCRQALTMYWTGCEIGYLCKQDFITALQKRWSMEVNEHTKEKQGL